MLSGFISLSITMFVRLLVAVVIFLFMASLWEMTVYGEFMYLFSVATLFIMAVDYGFSNQILKEVGSNPEDVQIIMAEFLGAKIWITIVFIVVLLPVLLGFLKLPKGGGIPLVILFCASACYSYTEFFASCLRAKGFYRIETEITLKANIILVVLATLSIYLFKNNLLVVSCAFLLGRAFQLMLLLQEYGKRIPHQMNAVLRLSRLFPVFRRGLPFGIEKALGVGFSNIDSLIMTYTLGFSANGIYQAGAKFYQAATVLPPIMSSLFLPKIAHNIRLTDQKKIQQLSQILYLVMAGFGVLIAGLFVFLVGDIQRYIGSEALEKASELAPWFGLLVMVRFLASSQGITITAFGGQKFRSIVFGIALVNFMVISIPLIHLLGMKGIIVSAIVSDTLLTVSFWCWLSRNGLSLNGLNTVTHCMALGLAGMILINL